MSRPVFDLPGLTVFLPHPVEKVEERESHDPAVSLKRFSPKTASKPSLQTSTKEATNTIISAVPVSRISGIERLGSNESDRLVGTDESDVLVGKLGDDRLIGGGGNDQITGGRGQDWLQGGQGFDRFFFHHAQEGIDYIDDFSVIYDWLVVSAKGFKAGLRPDSLLDRQQFHRGTAAADRSDRFIYHPSTGSLLFDSDGIGSEKPIEVAQLSRNLALTSANIYVIS